MDEILFYYKKCLTTHFKIFNGRARRKEFWMFVAVNMAVSIGISILSAIIGSFIGNILSAIYGLAILIPSIAVGIRRLHDISKSGWLILLLLIPLIGAVILIIWSAQPGTTGDNEYGPDPKETP